MRTSQAVAVSSLVATAVAAALAYVWVRHERAVTAEATREATLLEVRDLLADAVRRSDRFANRANRTLSPMPVMTPGDEASLRTYRNAAHVARARQLGVRVRDREELEAMVASGRLVRLPDSTEHWIVRRGTSPAHVIPAMQDLLTLVGARFQARLAELGLPPYRIEVTSALRTSERQARLRRTNANAAAGVSSHEFGTTVDLSYAAFAPPATVPEGALPVEGPRREPLFDPYLERVADLALESVSARKSRELGAILAEVLREAQRDGVALVIYERQQTVHHLTVARPDVRNAEDTQ